MATTWMLPSTCPNSPMGLPE